MDLESDFNETACDYTVNGTALDTCDYQEVDYHCYGGISFGSINGACFLVIFVSSMIGNSLLLCTQFRCEDLKRVTNIFVLNLACSDFIFTLTLPFWAVYHLSHWVFGDFACKFLTGAYFVGIYSSIILLTAMTVDRFATVVVQKWSSAPLRRQRWATGACAGAWIISIAASLSDAIDSKVEDQEYGMSTCEASSAPSATVDVKVGYYLQVSLLFLLPFTIIVFCYSAILRTVLLTATRRKHRTVVVVLCIVVAFFMCWAPYSVLIFLMSVYEPKDCSSQDRLDFAVEMCRILAYSHCCVNPVLYMLSLKFRRHLC